jgi:hypothetical protein
MMNKDALEEIGERVPPRACDNLVVFNYCFPPYWKRRRVLHWLEYIGGYTGCVTRNDSGWNAVQYAQNKFDCDTVVARKLPGGEVVAMLGRALVVLFVAFVVAAGCAAIDYYDVVHANKTSLRVDADDVTADGIRVDTGGHDVSMVKIDRYTDELEKCLGVKIRRKAFVVKFPRSVYRSKCTGAQLFPCRTSSKGCKMKEDAGAIKLLPSSPCKMGELSDCPQCPCHCRGAVQSNWAIVVTPDMVLYKATLASLVLGMTTDEIWGNKKISRCLINKRGR